MFVPGEPQVTRNLGLERSRGTYIHNYVLLISMFERLS
jgi:hypothetical protein